MIRSLVESYISQPECLILVATSMKGEQRKYSANIQDDIDNQPALAIARKHDPLGVRTIGVLPFLIG